MSKTNYAWDSTVVIAWLCEEASAPLDDMAMVVQEIDSGAANLILSVVVFSEILESKYTDEKLRQLERFFLRSNVIRPETSFAIAKKAAAIRDAAIREVPKRNVRTHAQIVASAIVHGATVLHTLDEGVLKLNGNPAVEGLPIMKPRPFSGRTIFTSPPA